MQLAYIMAISSLVTHGYGVEAVLKVPPANQDQWLVVLISFVYLVMLAFPLLFLTGKFPNKTPIQYSVTIAGKAIGKLFGFLFVLFMVFVGTSQLFMNELFAVNISMPGTSEIVIVSFILPACIYAASRGLRSLGGIVTFLAPVVLTTIVLFTLLALNKMDFKVLLPVMAESNLLQIQTGALLVAARFADLFILSMLAPQLKEKRDINRSFALYLVIVFLFETLIVISTLAALGIEQAKHSIGPYYLFIREIDVYDFIQRVESINVMMFYLSSFLRVSVYLYIASLGCSQLFGVKSSVKWIVVVALIMFANTLIPFFKEISSFTMTQILLPYIQIPFFFLLPLILSVIYLFRRKSF